MLKTFSNVMSMPYTPSAKNILAESENVCTFAAFKFTKRYNAADKRGQRFLYPYIINSQSNRVVVCGRVMPARTSFVVLNNTTALFCLTFKITKQ